jgi:hypothetical protein
MDLRSGQRILQRADFGNDMLIPGNGDGVVVSMVWPKIAARLYLITNNTSKGEVCELVQCIMGLWVQSVW